MFYIPYFLTANIRADAAVDDLILFKKLKKVPAGDKLLADEALATLSCHLWFSAPALSCSPSPVRSWRTGRWQVEHYSQVSISAKTRQYQIIQTFRSCLTKLSCGTWSPGNCLTLWGCLLNGWPCPLLSGIPTQTTSSLETLWEQSRWPMTVLREQLSLPPTTVSPSPRTARSEARYIKLWRRKGCQEEQPQQMICFMI